MPPSGGVSCKELLTLLASHATAEARPTDDGIDRVVADLRSTMQDFPLTLAALPRHPRDVHPNVRCSPAGMGPVESASIADVVERGPR